MVFRGRALLIQAIVLVVFNMSGCTSPVNQQVDSGATIVWPQPPAKPRIAYVKAFSTPEDLGITKGFFKKVKSAISGAVPDQMVKPMAVLDAGDGLIYVADPGVDGIHRYNLKKNRYHLIQRKGARVLPSVVGLAAGSDGVVYATDSELRKVYVIKPESNYAEPLEFSTIFSQPTGIAYDQVTRSIIVVDTGTHQVKVFSDSGQQLLEFGGRGEAPGEFNYPTMVSVNAEGSLLVTDSMNFRIQIFDRQGHFINEFGETGDGSGDLPRPKSVAVDRHGHIYVTDALFHALQVYDDAGQFLLSIGTQGQGKGEFWLPTGLDIGADDYIYIADSYNKRVQVLQYIGDRL